MNKKLLPLFSSGNIISPSLLKIFSILNMQHDGTFADIVQKAQTQLLRKKGQERWDIDPLFEDKRQELLPHLKALGFIDALAPEPGMYEYLLIFGFVTTDVKSHFDYIAQYITSRVIACKQVILLTSALPLPLHAPCRAFGATEAAMMQSIYHDSLLSAIPYTCIEVPMITENNATRRPTTADTVQAWIVTNPTPGNCLALSGQPFIRRQLRIAQDVLPTTFSVTPTGPKAEKNLSIALYLDELARAMYQEKYIADCTTHN